MRVAIIGAGIAGLTVAYRLRATHDVQVFEAASHVGGHTHTHDITLQGSTYRIDTGFIVYNDRTYPNFIALLNELGVASQPAQMSFSLRHEGTGLEYCGTNLNGLFAQRANLLRPRFYVMLRDIARFNRDAPALLRAAAPGPTLGEYLAAQRYGAAFVDDYLTPMGAAIWSSPSSRMSEFPARSFVQFFANHGLLTLTDRPQWYVLTGGSRSYVDALLQSLRGRIHTAAPVSRVRRTDAGAWVQVAGHAETCFDAVVLACHSDQALAVLETPSAAEREVLGAIPYQRNEVILHTDTRLMPRRKRAWASWNYVVTAPASTLATVTYDMNKLQSLHAPETFCVTLNRRAAIDPGKVIKVLHYDHPVYTAATLAAQQRRAEINGVNRTFFCGAYWRFGFHEDGVVSALDVVARLAPGGATDGQVRQP